MPQRRVPIRYLAYLSLILLVVLFFWPIFQHFPNPFAFEDAFNKTLATEPQFAGARALGEDSGRTTIIFVSLPLANLNPFIDAVQQLRSNYPHVGRIEAHIHVSLPPQTEMDFYKPASAADIQIFGNAAVRVIVSNPQFSHCQIHYLDTQNLLVLLAPAPLKDHQLFMDAIAKHYPPNQPKPDVRRWPVNTSSPLDIIFLSGQPPEIRPAFHVAYP